MFMTHRQALASPSVLITARGTRVRLDALDDPRMAELGGVS